MIHPCISRLPEKLQKPEGLWGMTEMEGAAVRIKVELQRVTVMEQEAERPVDWNRPEKEHLESELE